MRCGKFELMLMLMAGALGVQATQYWWAGDGVNLGGSGAWDASLARWGTSAAGPFTVAWPNGGGDEAIFTNAVGGAAGTITLSGTINVNTLSFKTNTWTLAGGTLNLGSGSATISMTNVGANAHQSIQSPLAGSGTLTVSGAAVYGFGLFLTANNSAFTGKVVANSYRHSLAITNDNALGAIPATYTPDAITLKNESFLVNDGAGTVSLATNRGIFVQNDNSLIFNRNSGTFLLNSPITGGGKFMLRKGLFVINSTNNTYTGQLHVYGEGDSCTVKAGAENVFSHGSGIGNVFITHWNGGTAVLDLNGYSQILPGLAWAGNGGATVRLVDNLASGKEVVLMIGDNNGSTSFDGCIRNTAGTLSLTKVGTGTQTLTGTNAYAGSTSVNGGTLLIDQATYTNGTLGALSLGGGTLSLYGGGASTNSSQAFGFVTLNAGVSGLTVTNRGGNATLALGNTWTHASGGVALITLTPGSGGTSTLKSSPSLTNGIVGGYVLVRDSAGTGFATTNASGNVVRYTGATTLDATAAAANLIAMTNYVISSNSQTLGGGNSTQTVNSLEFNNGAAGATLTSGSGKTLLVGSGGLLCNCAGGGYSKTQNLKITSGTGELDIYVNAAGFAQFEGEIKDNGGNVVSLVKWGGGTAYLSGNYGYPSYSGDTVINEGSLGVSNIGNVIPDGTGKGNVVMNGYGILEMYGRNETINGLSSASPLASVKNGTSTAVTLTLGNNDATASYSGVIYGTGAGALTLIKIGAGTQTLSGVSTYSGGTVLSNGVLSVSSTNNIGGANAKVTFAGGTLRITGTTFNSFGATPLTFTSTGGGLDIAEAGNNFTLTNGFTSGTVLTKTGVGMLTLTGAQAGTINTDDPSKITFGAGLGFYNLGILAGGVLSPAGSGASGTVAVANNLSLSGTYVADVASNGSSDTVTAGGNITLATGATLQIVNTSLLNRTKVYTFMTASGGMVTGSFTVAPALPDRWRLSTANGKVVLYYVHPGTLIRFF